MSTFATEFEIIQQDAPPPSHRPRVAMKGRVLAALAIWLLSGWYVVLPDQQAVETRFGKVVAPRVLPGLHYAVPWPVVNVTKLKVRQLQRLVVGGDLPDSVLGRTRTLPAQFLTGDQNIIHVRAVVQYSVGAPVDYLFQTQAPAQVVGVAVEAELARAIARRTVDAVLTTEKAAIQEETRLAAQNLLAQYRAGVLLSTVNIESAAPSPEAAGAFRDVASARADAARIVNEAQGYTNDVLPKARGEAQRLLEESRGYRERKINEASGDAARFLQIAAEYQRASQVTGRRLYLETMEQVLPKIKKVILDGNDHLDLTIVRKGESK